LYHGSPREADPESLRIKRQAYQVFVGGDVSVTVDKSGQAETGVWGPWLGDQECSRTCGGGVKIEKRQCKLVFFEVYDCTIFLRLNFHFNKAAHCTIKILQLILYKRSD
uniref:Papilin (inferred by orthology to a C. elegans protein) n=1 Tax=Anisakis simplex TaxID=6269 RepID=A0A0M3JG81_ANISI